MAREPFQYAVIRVVPRVEREEFVNVGVVVFCRTLGFLGARVTADLSRARLLAPEVNLDDVPRHLAALVAVAEGEPEAGPIAQLPQSERFGWLVAPSSTVIQTSSAHDGLCDAPEDTLEQLMRALVSGVKPV